VGKEAERNIEEFACVYVYSDRQPHTVTARHLHCHGEGVFSGSCNRFS